MFLHDWDNPIQVNSFRSSQDLKGIVKPISYITCYTPEYCGIGSFTVTEDVMATGTMTHSESISGSSTNGGYTKSTSSSMGFMRLRKGQIYYTYQGYGNTASYVVYPNVK